MKQLVSEWKDTVMKDTDSDRACLIRFHQFLGMEEENGPLYQAQLLFATETGRISDLARAYIDMIRHELRMKRGSGQMTVQTVCGVCGGNCWRQLLN